MTTEQINHLADEKKMLFSTTEVGEQLGITRITVVCHIRNKKLKASKLGQVYFIERASLKAFIENRRSPGRPNWKFEAFCTANGISGQLKKDFKKAVDEYLKGLTERYPDKKRIRIITEQLEQVYRQFKEENIVAS